MNDAPPQIEPGSRSPKRDLHTRAPIDRKTRYSVNGLEARVGAVDGARVVNISLGGIEIETHKHLQIGESYPLRFKRPSGLLRLTAAVVWSQLTRTIAGDALEVQPVFLAGLKFSDVSVTQKRELEELIAEELERVQGSANDADAATSA